MSESTATNEPQVFRRKSTVVTGYVFATIIVVIVIVLTVPVIGHGIWSSLAAPADEIPFKPGEIILDVGSNTCWAANRFAERGLRPIALDITTAELQGLYTAEYFIDSVHRSVERQSHVEQHPYRGEQIDDARAGHGRARGGDRNVQHVARGRSAGLLELDHDGR